MGEKSARGVFFCFFLKKKFFFRFVWSFINDDMGSLEDNSPLRFFCCCCCTDVF
jgi:hypothetical protein